MKGIGSSTSSTTASHASFAPRSSFGSIHGKLVVARVETQESRQRRDVMKDSMRSMSQLIVELRSQMPHLLFISLFPQFSNFNQRPTPNAEKEDEDEDLEGD